MPRRTDTVEGRKRANEYQRRWRTINKDKVKVRRKELYQKNNAHENETNRERVRRIKLEVFTHYSGGKPKCAHCGIIDLDVLCLDHIDGGGTKDRLFSKHHGANLHYFLRRNDYPKGFQVLCANCNLRKWVKYKK